MAFVLRASLCRVSEQSSPVGEKCLHHYSDLFDYVHVQRS